MRLSHCINATVMRLRFSLTQWLNESMWREKYGAVPETDLDDQDGRGFFVSCGVVLSLGFSGEGAGALVCSADAASRVA